LDTEFGKGVVQVSVEGTVQKEIMSVKTIAEALLHAAGK
jgi:hypothetical protein